VSVDVENGVPVKTRVGGHAVVVFKSEIKM